MTDRSRFPGVLLTLTLVAACSTELDVDHAGDHDHDYGELTWGRGVQQGVTVAGAWSPPPEVMAVADQQQVDYDGAPPYDGGANCSGGSTPGARVLRDVLIAAYPQIGSIGIYNCRVIAGTNSMSLHGVGRALDVMIPTIAGDANNTAGDEIAHWLMQNAELLGVQLIIWDRSIWSVSRSPRLRPYTGSSPHVDHLHIEINEAAAFKTLPWYNAPTGPGPAPACDVVGADGVVDAGPCQQLFGPARYWRTESGGHGGQLRWTNAYQGSVPSNHAHTTIKVMTPGRYRVEAFLDARFARFAHARYRLQTGGREQVLTVDQGATAPTGGGFVAIADIDIASELVVIVEDNVDFAPPSDARAIMVDAFRVRAATATPPTDPEPTPETDPTMPEPAPELPAPETPPETDPEPTPEPVPGDDDIIDEGDSDTVLDDDDPGAVGEAVIVVEGGCAQTRGPGLLPLVGFALLRRRRRR
jgi:hypothetical protein